MTQSNVVTSYDLNKYILKVFLHDIELSFWRRTYSENSATSDVKTRVALERRLKIAKIHQMKSKIGELNYEIFQHDVTMMSSLRHHDVILKNILKMLSSLVIMIH